MSKAGWLDRKGLHLGRWARRFFLLRDCFLFVCKAEPLGLAAGIAAPDHVLFLNVAGAEVRPAAPSKRHPWSLALTLPEPAGKGKEEHVLAAATEEERDEWIECIQGSIRLHVEAMEAKERKRLRRSALQPRRVLPPARARAWDRAPHRPCVRPSNRHTRMRSQQRCFSKPSQLLRRGAPAEAAGAFLLLRSNTDSVFADDTIAPTMPSAGHLSERALDDNDNFAAEVDSTNGVRPLRHSTSTLSDLKRQTAPADAVAAAAAAMGKLDNDVAVPAQPSSSVDEPEGSRIRSRRSSAEDASRSPLPAGTDGRLYDEDDEDGAHSEEDSGADSPEADGYPSEKEGSSPCLSRG